MRHDVDVATAPDPAEYPWPVEIQNGLLSGNTFEPWASVPTSGRTLVVAVGSNANPAILGRKLLDAGVVPQVPFVGATVQNLGIGHSAHQNPRGYIPATPFHRAGSVRRLVATWLDVTELRAIDATERNYTRIRVSCTDYPLMLDTGDAPAYFDVYESRRGVLGRSGAFLDLMSQGELQRLRATSPLLAEHSGIAPAERATRRRR